MQLYYCYTPKSFNYSIYSYKTLLKNTLLFMHCSEYMLVTSQSVYYL
jgi:hypothetical protein